QTASSVLEGDRVIDVRVLVEKEDIDRMAKLKELPLRTPDGALVKLSEVADLVETPGQLELRREDLRQNIAVTARLEGRDMGSAMAEIREKLGRDPSLPPGTVEFGGLYQQQQESFRNLMLDHVEHLRGEGADLEDALLRSGRRRLRPVLMTSMAAAFGMLPLAYGIGAGADMLEPLAIAVIGALCISVLLSLVATPTVYS